MTPCANLTMLFPELPFMERFAAAKEAGFDAVEILSPYDLPVQDVVRELTLNDLKMVLINCPPPNYTGGEVGWAAVPGSRFQNDFRRSLRYAQAMKTTHLHVMAGKTDSEDAKSTLIENLRWAALQAPKQSLTIEPLNADDQPGYFLSDFTQAVEILEVVDQPNVRLQYDAYHAQKIHGDARRVWSDVSSYVAHVQVGQTPKRTDPTVGEIDFPALFEDMKSEGYAGYVSGEYNPAVLTKDGLGWLKWL